MLARTPPRTQREFHHVTAGAAWLYRRWVNRVSTLCEWLVHWLDNPAHDTLCCCGKPAHAHAADTELIDEVTTLKPFRACQSDLPHSLAVLPSAVVRSQDRCVDAELPDGGREYYAAER